MISRLISVLLALYWMGLFFAVPYFNWRFAQEHGFSGWFIFGEIQATSEALVWPYYAAKAADLPQSREAPSKATNADSNSALSWVRLPEPSAASASPKQESSPKPIIPWSQLTGPVKTICVTVKFFMSDGVSKIEFDPPRSMDHQWDEGLEAAGYRIVPCASAHVRFRVTLTGTRNDSRDRNDTTVAVDMRATAGMRSGHYAMEVSTRKFSQDQDGTAYVLGFGMVKVMKEVDPQFKLPPAGQ